MIAPIVKPALPVEASRLAHGCLLELIADTHGVPVLLRTLCSVMEASRQPMFVVWGASQQLLHNAAYATILGERHPSAFGNPILSVWHDIEAQLEPLVARACAGESIHMDDIVFTMVRNGRREEAHFSFSFTPIPGVAQGEVLGFFCACTETTDAVREKEERDAAEVRRLRLFENAPGFIAVLTGPNHVFEFANAAYRRIVGGRSLIGRSVREAFPDIEQQGLIGRLDAVYATGERFVARGLALDLAAAGNGAPQRHYLDFVYEPIVGQDGAVTGVFVEGFDTTEAVRAQQSAAGAERRREEVLDSMGEGFIVLDTEFRLLEINAEGVRLDNRAKASIVGRVHWELWPASVGTPVEDTLRSVMRDRQSRQIQHRYTGEGYDLFVDMRVYPVTGGIAVIYRDVTALVTATTAMLQGNERFAAAMLAIGVMWTNSADGRMSGPQPGWQALTGQSEAEYAGYGWAAAVHPDDAEPTIVEWTRAVADRRMFAFEHRVLRHDGQWRRFAIRAVPVLEPSGGVREWVGVHIDITETFEAIEAVRAADRRKDEFLATLAHELRNPLGAIDSATALLQRPDLPSGKLQWLAGVLARQTRTMTVLLDELLDISRFRAGGSVLEPEHVELGTLIGAAIETVQHAIEAKGHRLEVRLAPALPLIFVDPVRTTQVITNLLTNAIKYTDANGRIEVSAAAADDHVCIEVTDNGIGLATESLSEIFEAFAQIRSPGGRSVGGLGIGLTLARRLVELQGGTIDATSAGLGRGSTFRVVLPVAAAKPNRP